MDIFNIMVIQIIIKVNSEKTKFLRKVFLLDANRRRPQQYFQRPILNYQNGNNRRNAPKQLNGRGNTYNNSEPTNTYHHPRPPPQSSRSTVPV
jgi:hypothetical protein